MPNYRRMWVTAKKAVERPLKANHVDLDELFDRFKVRDFGPKLDALDKSLQKLQHGQGDPRKAYRQQAEINKTIAVYRHALSTIEHAPEPGVRPSVKRLLDAIDTIHATIQTDIGALPRPG